MIEAFELVKKHGISALCFCALWWMNARLENVEEKLYHCYDQLTYKASRLHKNEPQKTEYFAILHRNDTTIKRNTKRHFKA